MKTTSTFPAFAEINQRQKYYRKARVKEQITVTLMLVCTILLGAFMFQLFANF